MFTWFVTAATSDCRLSSVVLPSERAMHCNSVEGGPMQPRWIR